MTFPRPLSDAELRARMGFPKPKPLRVKKRTRAASEPEIPEEDRTHVVRGRFLLWCGAKRIGTERSRIVATNPTCAACAAAISKAEKDARLVKGAIEEQGTCEW